MYPICILHLINDIIQSILIFGSIWYIDVFVENLFKFFQHRERLLPVRECEVELLWWCRKHGSAWQGAEVQEVHLSGPGVHRPPGTPEQGGGLAGPER